MGTLSAAPFNVGGAEQIVGAEHVSGAEHEHFDAAAACSGRLKRPPAPSSSQSRQQSEQQSEQQPRKREQRLVQCKRRRRAGSSTGGASSTAKQTRLLGADGGHANHKRAAGAASEAFNRKRGDDVERLAFFFFFFFDTVSWSRLHGHQGCLVRVALRLAGRGSSVYDPTGTSDLPATSNPRVDRLITGREGRHLGYLSQQPLVSYLAIRSACPGPRLYMAVLSTGWPTGTR